MEPTPTPARRDDRGAQLVKSRPPSLEPPLIGCAAPGRPAPLASHWPRRTRGTQGARNRARARQLNLGAPRAQARSLTSSPAARLDLPHLARSTPRPAPLVPAGAGYVPGSDPRALGGRGGLGSRDSVRDPRPPARVARESFAKSPSPVCPARAGTPTRPARSPLQSPRTPRLPARLARPGMVMEPRAWPGPCADVRATRSAHSANAARRAASCSDFFPAKTRHLGVAGPQEAVPGAGACLLIGRRSGGKRERGWGAPPPLSTAPPPSGPRLRPALRALQGAPSGQRGCVAGPGHPPHVGPPRSLGDPPGYRPLKSKSVRSPRLRHALTSRSKKARINVEILRGNVGGP
ncbi:translation initiation factor IF-2-like [Cebus imitator]|uniref:translation initiation factor IF-2-like n=1 Tax=Cebus imitator TaxID=2715852 RepID=UPI00080A5D5F|nr:translation initiation factor IF-2-like [Cebus imitator]